jgi:MFS family permease
MVGFGVAIALAPVHALRVGLANPGLFFLAYALGAFVAQSFGGRLSDRRGRAVAIVPGLGLATLGLWGVGLSQGWWLLPAAATFGAGLGLAQPNLFALAADRVAPERRGSVLASTGMFLEGGISSGATLGGIIGQAAGLPLAFLTLGSLSAIAMGVLLLTPWGRQTLQPTRAN